MNEKLNKYYSFVKKINENYELKLKYLVIEFNNIGLIV